MIKLVFIVLCFSLLHCTHLNTKITHLPYHTRKSQVLDKLGSPFQIKRINGLDHWIYKFKLNKRMYTRAVIFKEGHFLKSSKKKTYPNLEPLLEESETLEEYKKAIEHMKKNRSKNN